jgi:hypothetical protein
MKRWLTLLLWACCAPAVYSQGSEYALSFNGTSNYVSVGTSATLKPNRITVEAWIKPTSIGQWIAIVGNLFDTGSNEAGYGLISNNNTGRLMFWVQTVGGSSDNYNNYPSYLPVLNQWQHIAGTYNGSNLTLYVNGVQVDSRSKSGNVRYTNPAPLDFRIGQYYDDDEAHYYQGTIDEVRIWNTARSVSDIRTTMCTRLSGSEANLVGYWRFDEGSGSTLTDVLGNNSGTLVNMNSSNWVHSGAAIGNSSDFTYRTGNWSGQSVSLTSTNRGNLLVSSNANVTGTNGIQVYQVTNSPTYTNGISPGLGNNNVYYGIFPTNSSQAYTSVFDYSNYPDAVADENDLILYERANNEVSSWSNFGATLNTTANTLSKTNVSGHHEIVLGHTIIALPIQILSFEISSATNGQRLLRSVVASGQNKFVLAAERSANGYDWEEIATMQADGSLYTLYEEQPYRGLSYYRLRQTEENGEVSYSAIKLFDGTGSTDLQVFPIPAKTQLWIKASVEILKIEVYDFTGRIVLAQENIENMQHELSLTNLQTGTYLLKVYQTNQEIISRSIVLH